MGLANIFLWCCEEIELLFKALLGDNVGGYDAKHMGYQYDSYYDNS